jgi:YceI-like domain
MFKSLLAFLLMISGSMAAQAQDIWMTRNGTISFNAGTGLEDVEGINNEVASLLNVKTGDIAFNVPVKSFHFKRSLMEEHFNENYMETNKYPKASFQGKITDLSKVNFTKDGSYSVTVEGDLMIHGVTKKVSAPGTIKVSGGKISATAAFKVMLADHNIAIPGVVADKLSKDARIDVSCNYEKKN